MVEYRSIERQFSLSLALRSRPVAVKFRDVPLAGIPKFTGTEPSACSFWRLAAEGRTFYTVPGDHYNCPVGAHTHNIPLPENRSQELTQVLSLMASIGYLKMEEVPGIAHVPHSPGVVIYALLRNGHCTRSRKNWPDGQYYFTPTCATLSMEDFRLTNPSTPMGGSFAGQGPLINDFLLATHEK